MKRRHFLALATAAPVVNAQQQRTLRPPAAGAAEQGDGETAPPPANQTMKQLVRGTDYAATSMMPQSTLTAEHMLRAGGNAFDDRAHRAPEGFRLGDLIKKFDKQSGGALGGVGMPADGNRKSDEWLVLFIAGM